MTANDSKTDLATMLLPKGKNTIEGRLEAQNGIVVRKSEGYFLNIQKNGNFC